MHNSELQEENQLILKRSLKIQRKDPLHLKTKASEKSLNIKMKQEKQTKILKGTAIHTMW